MSILRFELEEGQLGVRIRTAPRRQIASRCLTIYHGSEAPVTRACALLCADTCAPRVHSFAPSTSFCVTRIVRGHPLEGESRTQ